MYNASAPSFGIHLRENIDEILPHCVVFHYEFVSFQFTKLIEQRCFQYPKFHCKRNQPCEKGCVNGATLRLLLHNKAENQLKETTLSARKYHSIFHKTPIHFIYKHSYAYRLKIIYWVCLNSSTVIMFNQLENANINKIGNFLQGNYWLQICRVRATYVRRA